MKNLREGAFNKRGIIKEIVLGPKRTAARVLYYLYVLGGLIIIVTHLSVAGLTEAIAYVLTFQVNSNFIENLSLLLWLIIWFFVPTGLFFYSRRSLKISLISAFFLFLWSGLSFFYSVFTYTDTFSLERGEEGFALGIAMGIAVFFIGPLTIFHYITTKYIRDFLRVK